MSPPVSYSDGCSRDPFIFTVMNEYLIRPAVGFEARCGMFLIFPLSEEAGNEQNTSLTTVMLLYFEDEGLNSLSDFITYKSSNHNSALIIATFSEPVNIHDFTITPILSAPKFSVSLSLNLLKLLKKELKTSVFSSQSLIFLRGCIL